MSTSAYKPFEVGARDRIVGLFAIGAVLLFLIGFIIPFIRQLADDEGVTFHTILDQTYGIAVNADVAMRGVPIGKVRRVAITADGLVRVDISLSQAYEEFYTRRSRLEVNTELSMSLLKGTGLILHPGSLENGLLDPGAHIATEPPQSFGSLLEGLDVRQLTDQVTEIVSNVEEITGGIADNQDKIYASLDNLEAVTASLAKVSEALPGMVESVDQSLASMQSSLEGVDRMIAATDADLQQTLSNSVGLTAQATDTLAEAEVMMRTSAPMLEQMPGVMITTDVALQSLTQLTDQISRSWLFGGSASGATTVRAIPNTHPHDDQLYLEIDQAPSVTSLDGGSGGGTDADPDRGN